MPDVSTVHIDQALTDVSVAYRNTDLVAEELFPSVPVNKKSNKYFIYSKDRFRVMDDYRQPGAKANEIEWTLSTDTYFAEGHALSQAVPDELRANADPVLDIDVDATEQLTDLVLLQREVLAASKAYDTNVLTNNTTLAGASQWNKANYGTSTPLDDIETGKETVLKAIGRKPNTLLLSYPVFRQLRNHPSVIERVKYAMKATTNQITPELLAEAFDLEKVIVAAAIKNTAKEAAADVMDYVWGKNALLFYRGPIGRRMLSLGAQFRWLFGMNSDGYLVKRYREEARTSDVIEVQSYYDLKVVAATAGYLIVNAVA